MIRGAFSRGGTQVVNGSYSHLIRPSYLQLGGGYQASQCSTASLLSTSLRRAPSPLRSTVFQPFSMKSSISTISNSSSARQILQRAFLGTSRNQFSSSTHSRLNPSTYSGERLICFCSKYRHRFWQIPLALSVAFWGGSIAFWCFVLEMSPLRVLEMWQRSSLSFLTMALISLDYKWTLYNEPNFRELEARIREKERESIAALELSEQLEKGIERDLTDSATETMMKLGSKSVGNGHNEQKKSDPQPSVSISSENEVETMEELIKLKNHWKQVRSDLHKRCAERLLSLCRANAGIFTKAGQHIASLNNVLPLEYTETMSVLQDKAPHLPYNDIVEVFESELGIHPSEIFQHFERVPIAAASLAQVHKAVLKSTGESLAVKVQYPKLSRVVDGDLKTIEVLVRTIGWLFPTFEFSFLLPEFRKNMNMELDFLHEAYNANRAAFLFHGNEHVHIPYVKKDLTTKRILIMEFVDGVKVTDLDSIQKMGFKPQDIAEQLVNLFSEQIHLHGFVHCDPHPGNILVRADPKGQPQIVLLDHGLYRELSPDFRRNYCRLWRALVMRNEAEITEYMQKIGAGNYADLFAVMLTLRPPSNHKQLNSKFSKKDVEELKGIVIGAHEKIADMMHNLHPDLLLVLRTTHLVRSVNIALGGKVNRFNIMARHSIKGSHFEPDPFEMGDDLYTSQLRREQNALERKASTTLWDQMSTWWERVLLEVHLAVLPAVLSLFMYFKGENLTEDEKDIFTYEF